MANTANYTVQTQQLVDNLAKWKNYIDTNTSVITAFNDTVDALQQQIDDLETRIEALELKAAQNTSYLKIDTTLVSMLPEKKYIKSNNNEKVSAFIYDQKFRSFIDTDRDIYVYSNKSVPNLTIDGHEVIANASIYAGTKAFYKFSGSKKGVMHHLISINAKAVSGVTLTFADQPQIPVSSGSGVSQTMDVNIKSSITKQIRTTITSDLIPSDAVVEKVTDTTIKVGKKVTTK